MAFSGAAFAHDKCVKIEAYGWGANVGTAKAQAKSAVVMKAEQWGARSHQMTSVSYKELECKWDKDCWKCESEAKVCKQ
jgi:hypothetical protein